MGYAMALTPTTGLDDALAAFYDGLGPSHLQPLWTQNKSLMPTEPAPRAVPYLWRWADLREQMVTAGRLVSIDRGGDRRVLALANPGLGGRPFATSTLWGALQYLGPGEGAPAHRHSQNAIRLVLEGSGVWTTVDGDACDMEPGDLVLTPPWTWHDHRSSSDEPMIWFDGLDIPLVEALESQFFELSRDGDYQEVLGRNLSVAGGDGRPGLAPTARPPSPDEAHSPVLVYRWEETSLALDAQLGAADGDPGVAELEFVSPETGGSVGPTLGCRITRLEAGASTTPVRCTGSSITVVRSGEGRSIVGGVEMTWSSGDMFVTPSWVPVEHHADRRADLFAVSDRPALQALHLYREARDEEGQAVVHRFEPAGPVTIS